MASLPNAYEMELRRRKMKKPNELLADPTAVGGRPPGTGGPSYIRPTIAGGVRPESGSGGLDFPTPPPGTVGSSPQRPVAAPQPIDAGMADRVSQPNARSVQGFVEGLPSDQIGGEINRAAQDRSIIAQRLGATFQMAQKARQSGDLDTYNQLMDQWQGGLEQRRGIESYGRDLSAARPRQFVTPEKAAADQPLLREQLIRAKSQLNAQQQADVNAEPAYMTAGRDQLPANILNAKFSSPQDQIRQRAFVDFASQEPVVDEQGNMATPEMLEQRRRATRLQQLQSDASRIETDANAAFPGNVDGSAMNNRYDDAATRAGAAGKRAAGVYAERQKDKQFQQTMKEKGQDVAKSKMDQLARGEDAESIDQQIRLSDARFRLSQVNRNINQNTPVQPRNIEPAVSTLDRLTSEVISGSISEQFSSPDRRDQQVDLAFNDVETAIPSMSPEERQQYAQKFREIRDKIVQNRSMFGRWNYADRYIKRIQGVLSSLEVGPATP